MVQLGVEEYGVDVRSRESGVRRKSDTRRWLYGVEPVYAMHAQSGHPDCRQRKQRRPFLMEGFVQDRRGR